MALILPTRRGFVTGLVSLIAAPAIVRASSLMPVRALSPWPGGLVVGDITIDKFWTIPENTMVVGLPTFAQVIQEAIHTWRNSPVFVAALDAQYDKEF